MFSYIPRSTDGKLHGNFTSEYQSNNNLLGNGLRVDYNNNSFFISLAASYRLAKNYRNNIDGRVYNTGFHEKTLSIISGFNKANGFSHFGANVYDNKQGIPDGSRDSISRKFTKQIFEGEDDIIKTRPVVDEKELNSYTLSPLHQHIQHYRIYTHNYYKLGSGDIDLNIAVQQNLRKEYNHPTVSEQPGMFVKLNTLNYSVRYNLPSLKNIEPSIGFNGMIQHNKNMDATDFPIPDYDLIDGGVFVYAKWKQQSWTLGGGIRYDLRQVKWKDFYIQHNPETGFDQHSFTGEAPDAVLQFPAYTKRFKGFSASMGITYQATDKISLKANIGRAYRAPNITEIASNGLDPGAHIIYLGNRNFDPEFSLQEDIGVSARYTDFSADISIFNNNIQNYIYQNLEVDANGDPLVDAHGNRTYKYQQAKAQLYGGIVVLSTPWYAERLSI
nr:TonB-dependent receptor [Niabella ginsengisoli]